jgi:hypothetical protein
MSGIVANDSEEIKALFHSYQECLNHGSTEEALALYAPDVSSSPLLIWTTSRIKLPITRHMLVKRK